MDLEHIVMELIGKGGDARSLALEAFCAAGKGDFEKADTKIKCAEEALVSAHKVQAELIQKELNGDKTELSLLLVHAQDHIMNAMTVLDLVKEMIEMLRDRM